MHDTEERGDENLPISRREHIRSVLVNDPNLEHLNRPLSHPKEAFVIDSPSSNVKWKHYAFPIILTLLGLFATAIGIATSRRTWRGLVPILVGIVVLLVAGFKWYRLYKKMNLSFLSPKQHVHFAT
eukprot:c12893_g1_i1.p1 GENE.c12893_g1_i1~~c12893_g1_i1.p1  ORF type:complete len:126 (-),score=11.81 c12893_g1_i1:83-460(-)